MFKKSLFFVYSLTAIFVFAVLFACGDSGGSTPDTSSNSNPMSDTPPPNLEFPVSIKFVPDAPVPHQEWDEINLRVEVDVSGLDADHQNMTFSKVEVELDNVRINPANAGAGETGYTYTNATYNISQLSCSGEHYFCAYPYLKSDPATKVGDKDGKPSCRMFKRENKGTCRSSSSATQISSSSSMNISTTLQFERITFSGANSVKLFTGSQPRGILLSSGTTVGVDQADIYFAMEDGEEVMKVGKSNITIIPTFDKAGGGNGTVTSEVISEGTVTPAQFPFRPAHAENMAWLTPYGYFMVRTGGATEWNSSCYLVLWPDGSMDEARGNMSVEVKVWKVKG
jgi:hypothetical protein